VFPTLRGSEPRSGFFEADQLAAVLRQLMEFAYLPGWRKREVLGLTWAQVNFTTGLVRLEGSQTKNSKPREFPFAALPQLDALLLTQRERTRGVERVTQSICPWVFHRNGAPIRSYDVAWRSACTRAGLPGRIVHDFRRSAARNLVRAGVPERVAMQLTGHLTRSVFDRYAMVNETDLKEGVAKLAAFGCNGVGLSHRVNQ
jgi:integrase